MQYLCDNCYYIGKGFFNRSDYALLEKFLWGVSIFFVLFSILYYNTFLILISVISFAFPIAYSAHYRGKKNSYCPKCKKESMIPLDTPRAQEIIKTHNLVIPEELVEPPKPKTPWQVN